MKPDKVSVACPHCGHVQAEPRGGYSTVCKKCRQHYRLEEALRPKLEHEGKQHHTQQVTCFQCDTLLEVAVGAESTMCKRCSAHIDLRNYEINQAVSKNFRTYGNFVVGEKGYVFNTEAEVGDAIIKGRFLGKIHAHRTLTLYAPTEFKGTFKAGLLIVPAGTKLLWTKPMEVQSVEIAGELVANVHIPGTVLLRSTGHLFGDVEAAHLIVEPGAVVVGQVKIGAVTPSAELKPAAPDSPEVAPAEPLELELDDGAPAPRKKPARAGKRL